MNELVGNRPQELVGGSSYEVFRQALDAAKTPLSPLTDPGPGGIL